MDTFLQLGYHSGIRFAGHQELLESFGPPERVRLGQYFQQRERPEFERPVAMGVIFCHQQCQALGCVGCFDARAEFFG